MREEIDGVLDDVALDIEVREDVDRGVGDEQRFGIGRHIHDEDMADAAVGAQPGGLCGHGSHQLVGVQTALHQYFALAGMDQLDGLGGGRSLAGRSIDDFEAADVQAVLRRRLPDLGCRSDENWRDDAGFRGFDGATQRALVAGMCDDGRHRRKSLRCRYQAIIFDWLA